MTVLRSYARSSVLSKKRRKTSSGVDARYSALFTLLFFLSARVTAKTVPSSTEELNGLEISSYHIQSVIISRYAVTTITCRLNNPSEGATHATFSSLLPQAAFITNLTIEAGGRNYSSLVKEREEAQFTYQKAKNIGTNAAIVHQRERDTTRFRIDVSVAGRDQVIFYLTYEELLTRRLGMYHHVINVHPNYRVRDVLVELTIHETRDISELLVKKVPGGDQFRAAVSEWREGRQTARLQFDPEPELLDLDGGLSGQLTVQYDVKRSLDAGDVQSEGGYFVHYFAPAEMSHTPKHITFLIDTSSSMLGPKLQQVKDALREILRDLSPGDAFSIVSFSNQAETLASFRYSKTAVMKAVKVVEALKAEGSTNLDEGLKEAYSVGRVDGGGRSNNHGISHLLIILTDGQPTHGVTHAKTILDNARKRNRHDAAIFALAFGKDAELELLERLTLQHGGVARRIYEEDDVAQQLHSFYREVATPLLMNVRFSYTGDAVLLDSLTRTHFHNYFKGSELVVSGQTRNSQGGIIRANITGIGRNGVTTMGVTPWNLVNPPDRHLLKHLHLAPTPENFVRRLWAFLSVKDLLDEEKSATSHHGRANARRKALALALQNHFVTPLTSLIVLQPDQEQCKDYEEDNDDHDLDVDDVISTDEEGVETRGGFDGTGEEGTITDTYSKNDSSGDSNGGDSEWINLNKLNGEDVPSSTPDSGNMARTYDLSPKVYSDYGDYPEEEYNHLDPQQISGTTDTSAAPHRGVSPSLFTMVLLISVLTQPHLRYSHLYQKTT